MSEFQQPVDEQELRLQLCRELSGENILEVKELTSGLFNNTYRVNTVQNAYVLKVGPERDADVFHNERNLMQRERSISQQLQSLSPLIPQYLSFFNIAGRDAFLQPFIQGRLWHEVIASLSKNENAELWQQLGALARVLHGCRGEQFGYPAPSKSFSRWSQFIADNVEGLVQDCRRLKVHYDEVEDFHRYLPHFFQTLDQVITARLLHGDLWPRNVIVNGAGADIHIKAVFDGERAFWGDPISDWVLLLYGVPEDFWRGYGENLLETRDPACIAIYRGMYFVVNILEATRAQESDDAPRKLLSALNVELQEYLSARQLKAASIPKD